MYNAGVATLTSCSITGNYVTFVVNLPDVGAGSLESGVGNGLDANVVVEGGGVYNSGSLTQNNGSISNNVASSTVTNGSLTFAGNFSMGAFGNGDRNGNDSATRSATPMAMASWATSPWRAAACTTQAARR